MTKMPAYGSELDLQFANMLQPVIYLIQLVKEAKKEEYIETTAEILQHVSEILRLVEQIEISIIKDVRDEEAVQSTVYPRLFKKFKAMIKRMNIELSKQLVTQTRICMGVWPPPRAPLDMLDTGLELLNTTKDLVDLAQCIGCYKVSDKPLPFKVRIKLL